MAFRQAGISVMVPVVQTRQGASMKSVCVLILILGIHLAQSQPAQVIIIRHAEEPNGDSIHLSAKGQRRAEALVSFFTTDPRVTQNGRPVALFAPRPRPNKSRRGEETLLPTARSLRLTNQEPVDQEQYAELARRLLRNPRLRGKTVVIAWTHSYIPQLAAALGVRPTPKAWKSSVYDRAYVITFVRGRARLVDLPQRVLPGDSTR
jgi:hypothetical protein